jgi:hypothetical protein
MDAALTGEPAIEFPPPGPFCARSGAFVTENGRLATLNGLLPGQTTIATQTPPTVIINTIPTILPSSTTSTTACVDSDPVTPGCQPAP